MTTDELKKTVDTLVHQKIDIFEAKRTTKEKYEDLVNSIVDPKNIFFQQNKLDSKEDLVQLKTPS